MRRKHTHIAQLGTSPFAFSKRLRRPGAREKYARLDIFRVNRPGESIASSGFGYDVEVARPDNFLVLLANAVTLHDVRDQAMGDPSGYANARGFEDSPPLRLHVPSRGDTSTVFLRVVVVPGNSLAGEKAWVSSGGCDFVTV
ncbi:hypothetical protein PM082_010181 [Marasmius tenuissimus]|nr:hypothetical protein PM082_010181 [Marasmius tenuissimus]